MAENKSILEEALLDVKKIQSALNANTKEILRSVAREEIDSVVKESLVKEIYEEEDLESIEGETELGGEADAASDDLEVATLGGEESSEEDELSDIEGSEEVGPEMDSEIGMDSMELGTEPMDMTAASDDEIIAIYKKLSGEDEIEIVGDEIHLNISEPGEYVVKTNSLPVGGEESSEEDEIELPSMDSDDSVDYEIEMDSDEIEGGESTPDDLVSVDDEEESEEVSGEEEEVEEIDETIANVNGRAGKQGNRYNGANHLGYGKSSMTAEKIDESVSNKLVLEQKKYNALLTEATKLKNENAEYN
jgi:hypothetical protein